MARILPHAPDLAVSQDGAWLARLDADALRIFALDGPSPPEAGPAAAAGPAAQIDLLSSQAPGQIGFLAPDRLLHIWPYKDGAGDGLLAAVLSVPALKEEAKRVAVAGAQRVLALGPAGAVVAPQAAGADALCWRRGELVLERLMLRGDVLSAVPAPERRWLIEQRGGYELFDAVSRRALARLTLATRQPLSQLGVGLGGRLIWALSGEVHLDVFRSSDGRRLFELDYPGRALRAEGGLGRLVVAVDGGAEGVRFLDVDLNDQQLRVVELPGGPGLLSFVVRPSVAAAEVLAVVGDGSEPSRPPWLLRLPLFRLPSLRDADALRELPSEPPPPPAPASNRWQRAQKAFAGRTQPKQRASEDPPAGPGARGQADQAVQADADALLPPRLSWQRRTPLAREEEGAPEAQATPAPAGSGEDQVAEDQAAGPRRTPEAAPPADPRPRPQPWVPGTSPPEAVPPAEPRPRVLGTSPLEAAPPADSRPRVLGTSPRPGLSRPAIGQGAPQAQATQVPAPVRRPAPGGPLPPPGPRPPRRQGPAAGPGEWEWALIHWAQLLRGGREEAAFPLPPQGGALPVLSTRLALSPAAEKVVALLYAVQHLHGGAREGLWPAELAELLAPLQEPSATLSELQAGAALRTTGVLAARPGGPQRLGREVIALLAGAPSKVVDPLHAPGPARLTPGLYLLPRPPLGGAAALAAHTGQPVLPLDCLLEPRPLRALRRDLHRARLRGAVLLADGLPGVSFPVFAPDRGDDRSPDQEIRRLLGAAAVPVVVCGPGVALLGLGLSARGLDLSGLAGLAGPGDDAPAPPLPSAPLPRGTTWRPPGPPAGAAFGAGSPSPAPQGDRRAAIRVGPLAGHDDLARAAYLAARDGAVLAFESALTQEQAEVLGFLLGWVPVVVTHPPAVR